MFPNNLASYLKDLKLSAFSILLFKLVASFAEYKYKLPVVTEQFELYNLKYIRWYIGMTKYKSSASSIVFPSIFVIHLVDKVQFLNNTCVTRAAVIVISPLTKI